MQRRSRHRPGHDYASTSELIADLTLIYDSLVTNGAEHIAQGTLEESIRTVAAFGLTLTTLDVREHAKAHHAALAPLIDRLGENQTPYESLSREERFELLATRARVVASARPRAQAARGSESHDVSYLRVHSRSTQPLWRAGVRELHHLDDQGRRRRARRDSPCARSRSSRSDERTSANWIRAAL